MLRLAAACLLLAEAASSAQRPRYSAIEVFENILKAQDRQVSLECEVAREERDSAGRTNRAAGTLKVRQGGLALLEIKEPAAQKVVSDGDFLWVELPDVKQVMKYDARRLREGGNFFLDLGSSVRHYAHGSVKRLIPVGQGFDEARVTALEMRPLQAKEAGFERMRVWVDHRDWVVRQVALRLSGVDTVVRFDKISLVTRKDLETGGKAALDRKLFRYRPPEGFQVFDLVSMP